MTRSYDGGLVAYGDPMGQIRGDRWIRRVRRAPDGPMIGSHDPARFVFVVDSVSKGGRIRDPVGGECTRRCSGSRTGVAPERLGTPIAPSSGSSAIGSSDDNTMEIIVGAVIMLAPIVLAIAGVVFGRRSRRASTAA